MKRNPNPQPNPGPETNQLLQPLSDGAIPVELRLQHLSGLRQNSETGMQVDRALLDQLTHQRTALLKMQEVHRKLESTIEQFTASPWHPAVFLEGVEVEGESHALVQLGSAQRLVAFHEDVDSSLLQPGQRVYLSRELNLVMDLCPPKSPAFGEVCSFEQALSSSRYVVRSRDEELVVRAAPGLHETPLQPGDRLVWDRAAGIVFEKVSRPDQSALHLFEHPKETFADIGGLDREIRTLQRTLSAQIQFPTVAARYQRRQVRGILLEGPPGTGKTLLAKAIANWLATLFPSGKPCFMNIKPSALHSAYYSQSEANYREAFRVARDVAAQNHGAPTVMFWDEVDAIGARRGESFHRIDDRVLTAFLAEMDGVQNRGNVIVIAATNRADSLDAALVRPGRLGDLVMRIPRPNARAARDILGRHLPESVPYARNGYGEDFLKTRQELIESTIARIYAPNGSPDLAMLTFRDGKRKAVRASDLVNGAVLANIAQRAISRACDRDIDTGQSGLQLEDLFLALEEEFDTLSRLLTPANCRHQLLDLPQDMDVVKVEPTSGRVKHPQRYLQVA